MPTLAEMHAIELELDGFIADLIEDGLLDVLLARLAAAGAHLPIAKVRPAKVAAKSAPLVLAMDEALEPPLSKRGANPGMVSVTADTAKPSAPDKWISPLRGSPDDLFKTAR